MVISACDKKAPATSNSQTSVQQLATDNIEFALSLYEQLASSSVTTQNIFVSPISISVVMAMLYAGSGGTTKTQLASGMNFTSFKAVADVENAFDSLLHLLTSNTGNSTVLMACRLFAQSSYKINQAYLTTTKDDFGAELASVDFVNNASGAVAFINSWVASNTDNLITNLLSTSDVTSSTRLIPVSTIYFHGYWNKPFPVSNTHSAPFYTTSSQTEQVQMMSISRGNFVYGTSSQIGCQVIQLPYFQSNISMFVILPSNTTTLAAVESKLTYKDLSNPTTTFSMTSTLVNLDLPKFQLDNLISLNKAMDSLGITDLFVAGKANLSGITGNLDLFVSAVIHEAKVSVTETGTVAAAATAAVIATAVLQGGIPVEFNCNRPFIFFIQDSYSGSILFLGRLVNPS